MADATFSRFDILKSDDEQRLVFGLAQVSARADGQLVTDLQSDQITPEELEKGFYGYVLNSRRGDVDHEQMDNVAALVESFVATPEKLNALLKALGVSVDLSGFKGAAAWVGFKVFDDDTWARVKSGELRAFSIEAEALREAA